MPSYRLHYFPESGNSYKLALMLTLCGQRFEPVWTDFGGGVTRTPEWRRDVNEMGEIPVLEVDGAKKVQPRKPPGIGEHSDEILRTAGYDEAAIGKLRASGAVA